MKDIFCGGALLLALLGYGSSTPSDNFLTTASSGAVPRPVLWAPVVSPPGRP